MNSFLLPDVNLWLAINHEVHHHHLAAIAWFNALDAQQTLIFCRQTQMGLFRLLSTESICGKYTLSLKQCWKLHAEWIASEAAELWAEPADLEALFARMTASDERSPKRWNDAYLAAFAETADVTLVTFDKALAGRVADSILLR